MKPAPFDYFEPMTVAEALALLQTHGPDAKVMAGGQSLMPMLAMRLAKPAVIVDINRISELDYLCVTNSAVQIGALTRHRTVERSPLVGEHAPLLQAAARWIGHVAIRTRGSIGGSVAHADPAAEYPAALVALGARLVIAGSAGRRTVAAREFFLGYMMTALASDELLVGVELPPWPVRSGAAFAETARRHGDFALAGAAAWVQLDEAGAYQQAGLALCGVGGGPVLAEDAAAALAGRRPGPDLWASLAQAVAGGLEPDSDLHASAPFRRQLAAAMVEEALATATAQAATARGGSKGA